MGRSGAIPVTYDSVAPAVSRHMFLMMCVPPHTHCDILKLYMATYVHNTINTYSSTTDLMTIKISRITKPLAKDLFLWFRDRMMAKEEC